MTKEIVISNNKSIFDSSEVCKLKMTPTEVMNAQTFGFSVITIAIAVASAIVGILSFHYNSKMNKLNSLVKAFEIIKR